MTPAELSDLLEAVRAGTLPLEDARARLLSELQSGPLEDLGFARVDHQRRLRQGFPEVVLGLGKTPEQVSAIAHEIARRDHTLLVTRATLEQFDVVRQVVPGAVFNREARTITLRQGTVLPGNGIILIAAAGTSDVAVAEEAAVTAELMGNQIDRLYDVGVAGLHRLLREYDRLAAAHVIIVIAGMEGALPSVVSGLVQAPVIAVPSSVGYGASFGGIAALLGMLNSCASGVAVVNIDNGFGAAFVASLINHLKACDRS